MAEKHSSVDKSSSITCIDLTENRSSTHERLTSKKGNNFVFKNGLEEKSQIGYRVDIRDPDHIWSSGRVIAIKGKTKTTIRYDGWDSGWDETLEWQNNDRLSIVSAYTKRYKCMVDLYGMSTQKSKSFCPLWPCIVNCRMPDPVNLGGMELLRTEPNIFIEPYGMHNDLLPNSVLTINGGIWIRVSRIKIWKDLETLKMTTLDNLMENFEEAYGMAVHDKSVPDLLPYCAFEKASLLKEKYLVKKIFDNTENKDSSVTKSDDSNRRLKANNSSNVINSDTDSKDEERAAENLIENILPHNLATLPPGVNVIGKIYAGNNVKKLEKLGKFCATVSMGGNDFLIGRYSTQYQAETAVQKEIHPVEPWYEERTLARVDNGKTSGVTKEITARLSEINDATLETIVASCQGEALKLKQKFTIHEWALQHVSNKDKIVDGQSRGSQKTSLADRNLGETIKKIHKGRKQKRARRVRGNNYEALDSAPVIN